MVDFLSVSLCTNLKHRKRARHGTARHGTARHGTARHGTARHRTAPHRTAPHRTHPPTHSPTHAPTHARARARTHPPTHPRTHACTHPPTHPRTHASARTRARAHTRTRARTHTHTQTTPNHTDGLSQYSLKDGVVLNSPVASEKKLAGKPFPTREESIGCTSGFRGAFGPGVEPLPSARVPCAGRCLLGR